jgi:TnpA family transposase
MARWDYRYLGFERFPDALSALEIEQFFALGAAELAEVGRRRGSMNRLAVALQIGFVKMTGAPLNSVQLIPGAVLDHLGLQLESDEGTPRIASIRALYRRRRTLFDHQQAALKVLGFRYLHEQAEPGLIASLRRAAADTFESDALVISARVWLFEHRYVIPPPRRLRRLAIAARRHHDAILLGKIEASVTAEVRAGWVARLLQPVDRDADISRLDWLRAGPVSKKPQGLADHIAKVSFLKSLGADRLALGLSLAGLRHHARPMLYRKPAAVPLMRAPRRTLELACFLRLQLLRLSDSGLDLLDHRIADLWRGARNRVEDRQDHQLRRYRRLVAELHALLAEEAIAAEVLRDRLKTLMVPFPPETASGKTAAIRRELSGDALQLTAVLAAAHAIGLDLSANPRLAEAWATLDAIPGGAGVELPKSADHPFGPTWAGLINQPDRAAALQSYRAATVMLLKRSLRNGSASVEHSLNHRAPEDRLIPAGTWERERGRLIRSLNVPESAQSYLGKIEAALLAGLAALDEAVAAGVLDIEDGRIAVPRPKAQTEDPGLEPFRRALFGRIGPAQLPNVLVEVDSHSRFSWSLLSRAPRSEQELVTAYAALVALGSDLTAADLMRMTPGIGADSIGQMMARLESGDQLRQANAAVLTQLRAQPIVSRWGQGLHASADMMSLEATRYLWSARIDPRRRTYAAGTYAHVLDQWGIIYDQPIILNHRQAGAAIEGALRQDLVDLERVAVDTHGFTHFAMALAKLTGFDLCPRLAGLKDRKLYLPRGLDIPARLRPVARETVSRRAIARGWDPLLRIAASVSTGWVSATYVVDRFGSASRGHVAFEAGDALGKLLRTLYLCDYLGNPSFRTDILNLLNQGESVHSLERAIHAGGIGAKRGRTSEQLAAISGALSLLANIIMAWNTQQMQALARRAPEQFPDQLLSQVAPVAHAHINMRGTFAFELGPHRKALLGSDRASPARRTAT